MHLVNGTGSSPSPGQPTPGVVKQDKSSRGSKTRSHPQRVRMSSRERPIGAAKGKQSNTKALRQPPPPSPEPIHLQRALFKGFPNIPGQQALYTYTTWYAKDVLE